MLTSRRIRTIKNNKRTRSIHLVGKRRDEQNMLSMMPRCPQADEYAESKQERSQHIQLPSKHKIKQEQVNAETEEQERTAGERT